MREQLILVTGASGFVGHAICQGFAGSYRIRAAVRNLANVRRDDGIEYVEGPLDQGFDWTQNLAGVDVVIHCAGVAHIAKGQPNFSIDAFDKINVQGTAALARQAASAGVKRFVFISSIGVNGDKTERGKPFHELLAPQPVSIYAKSKLAAEKELELLAQAAGLEIVVIRPPMVYGANAPGNFRLLRSVLERGWPLPFGAIRNLRSFVGIDNLMDFVRACVRNPKAANETFVVSDGQDLSTTELLNLMRSNLKSRSLNLPVPERFLRVCARLARKEAAMTSLCADLQVDISKARHVLNWAPIMPPDIGIAKALLER